MTYDDLGRVLTETVIQPGVETHTLTRSYNDAGKPSGYQWKKGKDQLQVEYGYHTSGRLDTVSDGETKVTYEYLANYNLIEHTTYHNQNNPAMRTTEQYDRLGRLLDTTTRRLSDAGDVLSSYNYQYNLANQRMSSVDEEGANWDYRYDSLGQVISGEKSKPGEESIHRNTYDYDSIGNRKQSVTQRTPRSQRVEETYESNLLNQYEGRRTLDTGKVADADYKHDADGNLLEDDKWSYEWNGENRLIAMESLNGGSPQRLKFGYDPQGRRILKEIYESEPEKGKAKKAPKWRLTKQHHYPDATGHKIMNGPKNSTVIEICIIALLALCSCTNPFSSGERRSINEEYVLERFDEGGVTYTLQRGSGSEPGGIFEGVVNAIAWDADWVLAEIDKLYDGDPGGWYALNLHTSVVNGPLTEQEIQSNPEFASLTIKRVAIAFERLD